MPNFQCALNVELDAVRSRTFSSAGGGVQLRIGATWLDAVDGEPLESPAWPADRYTAALWQLRTPIGKDVLCGQASITVGSASKLKWRCLSDGEHYFVIDVAERNPPCCLYVEMSVATFADEPSSPDQAGASPDEG